jgi:hypothetical protein
VIRNGDLVKRYDDAGTGTGILYRVINVGEEREYKIKRQGHYRPQTTRKVKLQPVIVMFEAKRVSFRQNVTHYECELKHVDIVQMGIEYTRLGMLLQDEARRRAGEQQDTALTDGLRMSTLEVDSAHR